MFHVKHLRCPFWTMFHVKHSHLNFLPDSLSYVIAVYRRLASHL